MAKIIKIPSAYVLDSKVVGVSKPNEDGTERQAIIKKEVLEDDILKLELDPQNPYYPDAVKVLSKYGNQIGFLSREVAQKVKPAIVNQADVTVKASWVSGEKMLGVGLRIEMVN